MFNTVNKRNSESPPFREKMGWGWDLRSKSRRLYANQDFDLLKFHFNESNISAILCKLTKMRCENSKFQRGQTVCVKKTNSKEI